MQRSRWIVVGTDFSEGAARALEEAASLAAHVGASVTLVHAYEDTPGTPLCADRAPALCAALEEAIAACGARARGVHVEAAVRRGPACEKLLNVACELGAPLIVVGANGEGHAPPQRFLGSVATRLAAISTRMVLIVPERVDAPLAFHREAGAD
jgi:nucleotide-binding universal stress UspA family protein